MDSHVGDGRHAYQNASFQSSEVPTVSGDMARKEEEEKSKEILVRDGKAALEQQDHDEDEGEYGWAGWRPSQLQCLNNVRAHVVFHCLFNFFEGFIVNGVINVIIVALETRYKLTSTKSGIIASGNDFGAFPFFLVIGFLVEGRSKPRFMAGGNLLMAVGSLLFALPHFLGGQYTYQVTGGSDNSTVNLCVIGPHNDTCSASQEKTTSDFNLYPLFILGQVLLGIGAAPMFTVGLTYVDENTTPKMTSFYTGLIFSCAAVGVAVGYVVAGQTLALYVDIDSVDIDSVLLTPNDRQWVGAWWVGILIAFGAFLLIGFPILGYPRHMPGYNKLRKVRSSEVHDSKTVKKSSQDTSAKSIKDFPRSVAILLTNPAFVLLCLAATFDTLIIAGTATFGAKILQEFFQVDITTAGTIMGAITVPGAGGGMLLGGWIVKRWSLKCRGIMKMCMTFTLLSLLFSPSFFAHCPRIPMAGVDRPLFNLMNTNSEVLDLTASCNTDCGCDTQGIEPVCYRKSLVFFSPCHAGCTSVQQANGTKVYKNCSCPQNVTSLVDAAYQETEMVTGSCAATCAWVYVFCVLFFCIMVCTFATMSPNVTAVMRCVPFNQRSQAVGFQLLAARGLGTTPGPILFGLIVDSACVVWQESTCTGRGVCWLFDQQGMALRIMIWWIVLKLCGALMYGLAACVYKPPEDNEEAEKTGTAEQTKL